MGDFSRFLRRLYCINPEDLHRFHHQSGSIDKCRVTMFRLELRFYSLSLLFKSSLLFGVSLYPFIFYVMFLFHQCLAIHSEPKKFNFSTQTFSAPSMEKLSGMNTYHLISIQSFIIEGFHSDFYLHPKPIQFCVLIPRLCEISWIVFVINIWVHNSDIRCLSTKNCSRP